mgnify:CR=1 FL=1
MSIEAANLSGALLLIFVGKKGGGEVQKKGFRFQVSEGEGSDNEELYGCAGQRAELRGQRSEDRDSLVGAASLS